MRFLILTLLSCGSFAARVLSTRTSLSLEQDKRLGAEVEPELEQEPTISPHSDREQFEIERLPIEFLVEEGAPALSDGETHWFCVKIRLLPEDGGDKYAMLAKRLGSTGKRVYSISLTPEAMMGDTEVTDGSQHYQMELGPHKAEDATPYRGDHAKAFIASQHAAEDEQCSLLGGVYTQYAELQAYIHERMTKYAPGFEDPSAKPEPDRDVLETHVNKWNKQWARVQRQNGSPNGCKTQKTCSGYHVSYVKVPDDLQKKFTDRLRNNWKLFYETDGAGIAGTTGASFVAGNRGYRFPNFGQGLMDTLFPAKDDFEQFEDALKGATLARKDIQKAFGRAVNVDFQHRLWRYGPDFPVKGGIWHKDTCPFGIGGGVPEGGWQLTSVYVFYASNLDLSQSGTRLKDRFGVTHDMPCVPGTANVMRSGENDPYSPWHAGPVLKKLNHSAPAYRVMLQSKMILRKADHEPPAGAEAWGGLGFKELPRVAAAEEKAALKAFFKEMSQALAWGASESNAVGTEAYPVNATRAWARTEELAVFFGFQGGFLPTFSKPPVDVEDENEDQFSEKDDDAPSPDDG